ncbi:hypothetical protein M9H77_18631 [Catharanthus roseus]|uniref:Uncharacterized protein n=1 Tax=Catharanthus roseus TaxID=4058 RepID=A0ACC0B806_CATRO|nr:hypothetical protein M9H77_18631 [Catharanthus roseus]
MEHERILRYKLYKTISFFPSTSGMGKELSIGFEDTSIRLYLNPFLLYHEFSVKEFVVLRNFVYIYAKNMKFGMQRLLFDPRGWDGVTLVLNKVLPNTNLIKICG